MLVELAKPLVEYFMGVMYFFISLDEVMRKYNLKTTKVEVQGSHLAQYHKGPEEIPTMCSHSPLLLGEKCVPMCFVNCIY